MKFISKIGVVLVLISVSLVSCSSKKSVQQYLLEKQSSPDFISLTLPASILNIAVDSLEADQREAVEALSKLNVLVYHATDGVEGTFEKEEQEITQVLSNSKYEDLMKAQTQMGSGRIMFMGSESKIDEFLAFGSDHKENFILVRVLGNNMNPKHIKPFISALQKSDVNEDELLGILSTIMPEQPTRKQL